MAKEKVVPIKENKLYKSIVDYYSCSLKRRLGFNLAFIGIFGFLVLFGLVILIISNLFSRLEYDANIRYISQVEAYLNNQKDTIASKTADWSNWDDTFQYIQDFNKEFEVNNTYFEAFKDYEIDGASFVRLDGTASKTFIYDNQTKKNDEDLARQMGLLANSIDMHYKITRANSISTYARFGDKLYVIAASKIRNSSRTGNVIGFLMMVREIKAADINKALQSDANLSFIKQGWRIETNADDKKINISYGITGIDDSQIAVIHSQLPRDLKKVRDNILLNVAIGVALLIGLITVIMGRRISEIIVSPIVNLKNHNTKITSSGSLETFQSAKRNDEIGQLYDSFNNMIDTLKQLRMQVEAQSFEIGKSQSQSELMHNIRNSLSPIAIILNKLKTSQEHTASANMFRAVAELEDPKTELARRQKLANFARISLEQYTKTQETGQSLVNDAQNNLSSIIQSIEFLQQSAKLSPEKSICDLSSVIEKSLSMVRHYKNPIKLGYKNDAKLNLKIPGIILAQIFDNILTNSLEAIESSKTNDGAIEISIIKRSNFAEIKIKDNGDGFEKSKSDELFLKGFSTREFKSGGLGLHWCANTLNSYGGSIALQSQGKGKGAVAILRIPLARANEIKKIAA